MDHRHFIKLKSVSKMASMTVTFSLAIRFDMVTIQADKCLLFLLKLSQERVSRSLKQCQTSNLKQEASCLFANGMKHVLLCSVNVTTKSFGHGFDGCQNLFRNSEKECLYT